MLLIVYILPSLTQLFSAILSSGKVYIQQLISAQHIKAFELLSFCTESNFTHTEETHISWKTHAPLLWLKSIQQQAS